MEDPQGQAELDIDMPFAINIKPTEVVRICDAVLKLGLEASSLQMVKLVWEQLKKISNQQNPALQTIQLMDVFKPSIVISGALPSPTHANYGKRDPSWDGWRNEKHQKFVLDQIQADEHCDHPGITSHQAEIWPNINEPTFKVPEPVFFPDNDIRYSCPKRDIPL